MQLRRETCFSVTFRHDTGCNKGLLLHSRLRAEGTGQIVQVAHLITLVLRKCDECLHLHILRCHQRTGHMPQVDPFISLVDMICSGCIMPRFHFAHRPLTALHFQRCLQLRRQRLAAFFCPAQDAFTGRGSQIVFLRRMFLQNLR